MANPLRTWTAVRPREDKTNKDIGAAWSDNRPMTVIVITMTVIIININIINNIIIITLC